MTSSRMMPGFPRRNNATCSGCRRIFGRSTCRTERRVEWMALPRAAALAEVGWSPQQRSWPDFLKRLVPMVARYRAFGINYADSVFGIESEYALEGGAIRATLSNLPELTDAALDAGIRYTLDGREPTAASTRYAHPLDLQPGTELRAATFLGSEQASRVFAARLDSHTGARRTSHQLELCSNGIGLSARTQRRHRIGCAVCGRHHESVLDLSRRGSDSRPPLHRRCRAAAIQL